MKGEKNFYFSSAISTFVELHSKIEVTAEEVRENVGRNEMKWKTIGRAFWLKQIKSEFQFAWKKKDPTHQSITYCLRVTPICWVHSNAKWNIRACLFLFSIFFVVRFVLVTNLLLGIHNDLLDVKKFMANMWTYMRDTYVVAL